MPIEKPKEMPTEMPTEMPAEKLAEKLEQKPNQMREVMSTETSNDRRAIRPTLTFPPALLLRARGTTLRGIRAAIFDVDGVLTDGRIYIGEQGETFKAFATLDGHGLKLLAAAGITPIVITGRDSPAVRKRVADLGITHAAYGASDKLSVAESLLATLGVAWDEVAAMGDDWPDLPLLQRAALACAPIGAHAEVKAMADHVTTARAGHGAARECCDLLLIAAGRYAELLRGSLPTLDHGR